MYVFGVVLHHGEGGAQSRNDIHLYSWMEYENCKNSNMIASALNHCFRHVLNQKMFRSKTLRLFSDSCYGQNKNMNVLSMLFCFANENKRLQIEYTFPVRGHSFLPADRVFGRIQQTLKKQETILLPSAYEHFLKQHGNVYSYNRDWHALNFKKAVNISSKLSKHSKLVT